MDTVAKQFAQLGTMGIDADINAVSAAINAFGVEADQIPSVMDDLFRVSQATGLSITDLANAAQSAAPALVPFGFSLSESAALAGQLDKAGLNSTKVMESLKRAFVEFGKQGRQAPEAFRETIDEIKNFIDIGDIAGAIDVSAKLFGTRGAADFVKAVQDGVLALDDLMGSAGVTADTIDGLYQQTKSFPEAWQEFKNAVQLALEPMATAIFNALTGPLEQAGQMMNDYGGVIAPVAVAIGTLAGALTTAAIAQGILNAVMATNPFVLVIAAVAALAAGLYVAYQKSETFRNAVQIAGMIAKAAFELVSESIRGVWRRIGEMIDKAGSIGGAFRVAMEIAKGALQIFMPHIGALIGLIERVKGALSRIHFPSPPAWMSKMFSASPAFPGGFMGVPNPFTFMPPPIATFGYMPELIAARSTSLTGLSAGSLGRSQNTPIAVDNSIHITVDGSGVVDPRAIVENIQRAFKEDGRNRGMFGGLGWA